MSDSPTATEPGGLPLQPLPSVLHLPAGQWVTLLDGLCAHFAQVDRDSWLDRFARGRVLDAFGVALSPMTPYREGLRVTYFREVLDEIPVPLTETVLYADDHLVVVDKPHFLAVVPAGKYVNETVLARLIKKFDNPQLVPLHRIDRHTAGLVVFSANAATRSLYQALFRQQKIIKSYEAMAPALPQFDFPLQRSTRLVAGEPFFRMREVEGLPNTETHIDVLARGADLWHYRLTPLTGKKHQLRVHMAALGAPICNDPFYPDLREPIADDYAKPLQLLARSLRFDDPLTRSVRFFESGLRLSG